MKNLEYTLNQALPIAIKTQNHNLATAIRAVKAKVHSYKTSKDWIPSNDDYVKAIKAELKATEESLVYQPLNEPLLTLKKQYEEWLPPMVSNQNLKDLAAEFVFEENTTGKPDNLFKFLSMKKFMDEQYPQRYNVAYLKSLFN